MSYYKKQNEILKSKQKKENLQETVNLILQASKRILMVATAILLTSFIALAIFNDLTKF